jgi:hypothetical protein
MSEVGAHAHLRRCLARDVHEVRPMFDASNTHARKDSRRNEAELANARADVENGGVRFFRQKERNTNRYVDGRPIEAGHLSLSGRKYLVERAVGNELSEAEGARNPRENGSLD